MEGSNRSSRGLVTAAAALLLAVLVAACGGGSGSRGGPAVASQVAAPPPVITITPDDGAQVRIDQQVAVQVNSGRLSRVTVHTASDPAPLAGLLSPEGNRWLLQTGLDPNTQYVLDAAARADDGGNASQAHITFSTAGIRKRLTLTPTPDDGAVVGVAMPIVLRFDEPVAAANQVNLVKHLAVESTAPMQGAWHWYSDSEVHYRPITYWPPHTKVTLHANLRDVDAGDGVWGLAGFDTSFTVGDKHSSLIDAATHQMSVFLNDQPFAQYPVSTGRPGHPTLEGNLYVVFKTPDVIMDSQTIGIPRTSPDGYYQHVQFDTAISGDGFFIHSAPWSVGSQGYANVSHGCVNLSPSRAEQFFNFSVPGDLVIVQNTGRPADASDGEADWNLPFAQYGNSGADIAPPSAPSAPGGA